MRQVLKYYVLFFLSAILIWFVFYLNFIPSWYKFQIYTGLSIAIILLLSCIYILIKFLRATSKTLKKTVFTIFFSLWILVCITSSVWRLFAGQVGEWFYGLTLYEKLELTAEWKSDESDYSVYIYKRYGHTVPEHLWISNGKLPLMKRIWKKEGITLDSINENKHIIRITGEEHYPYLKPMEVLIYTQTGEIVIQEDYSRPRAIGAPDRK